MTKIGTIKRRKPWLAAVVSLINTGWGQFYCGNWKRGLMLLGIEFLLGAVLVFCMGMFSLFVLCGAALIGFNVYVAVDAYLCARDTNEYALKPCNRWWVYALLIVCNIGISSVYDFTVSGRFYNTYKIPSGSMLQTLQIGDHLMAEMLAADDVIKRGDVVIVMFPEIEDKNFIKRVIALPGETLAIRDKVVFINGKRLDEPYVYQQSPRNNPRTDDFGPSTTPAGQFFLMGDNRQGSHDSRFVGTIKRADILARAKYLYYPGDGEWSRWGKTIR
jgi:signal peptidase I